MKNFRHAGLRSQLGDQFRDRRRRMGLQQGHIYMRVRLAQSCVSTIENGAKNVGIDAYVAYAHALGCRLVLVPLPHGTGENYAQEQSHENA